MTAACAASTAIKVEGCTVFAPIYGSKKDTTGTRAQVDAHNAKGVGACGWQP
jgi:hypothetical protein